MSAAARAALSIVPIPVEAGSPVRAVVTSVESRWTVAWAHDGGRHLEPFGESYTAVRDALRAAEALNARSGQ